MKNRGYEHIRVKPVAAAVGVALSALFAAQAYAAQPAANLPANGKVVVGTVSGSSSLGDFGGSAAVTGSLALSVGSTMAVVVWGSSSAGANIINPTPTYGGFNINRVGTTSSTVSVGLATGTNAPTAATLLNIDTNGQASMLDGELTATGVNVFLANANGIVVGSKASFSVPVLGLLNANVPGYTSMDPGTTQAIGVNFAGASGGVTVNDGASFTGGSTVIIAGAGAVNVSDTAPVNSGLNLTLVGGVRGNIDTTAGSFAPGAVATVGTTTYALSNAASTAVNLNLGHLTTATQAAAPFTLGGPIYATGDVVNNGDLSVSDVQWGGTYTNNGVLTQQSIGTSAPSAAISNNFVNAGTLNATTVGTQVITVAGNVTNTGTIALSTSAPTDLSITAGNSVTLGGSVSGSLGTLALSAGTANPGQGVTINTNPLAANGSVTLTGFNVAVNSNVSTNTDATVSVGAGSPNATAGLFSLSSGATLSGSTILIGANSNAPANASIGGTVSAPIVTLDLNTVNVGGNIATNSLGLFLTGDINKVAGGGTAANNYLDNAAQITQLASTGPVIVTLDAMGNHAQRFNLKVTGDASITSDTDNFAQSGINNGGISGNIISGNINGFNLPAPNQLSQLRFQTTGNLFVQGGNGLGISPRGSFTWPGLTVLMAGGNLISNAAIDNALGAVVPGGNGVFLQGNTLQLNAPVYTSGNAWINFLQTGFGSATTMSPLAMTAYYVATQPSNTATGVSSYVPTPAPSSQLKTGRAFVTGYVPQ